MAAAAAASASNGSNANLMGNMAFLSSFGLNNANCGNAQNKQFANELWPWFNMAAMSSLYGAESK